MTSADRPTRREALRSALAGGVMLALVRDSTALASSGDQAEVETLARIARLEQTAAVAYRALAEGVALPRPMADAAGLFGRQAQEHADALRALEDSAGRRPRLRSPATSTGSQRSEPGPISSPSRSGWRTATSAPTSTPCPSSRPRHPAALHGGDGQRRPASVVLREAAGATPAEAVPTAFEIGRSPAPG